MDSMASVYDKFCLIFFDNNVFLPALANNRSASYHPRNHVK